MNSGWKTASQVLGAGGAVLRVRAKTQLATKLVDGRRLSGPLLCPCQRPEEPLGVSRGSKQMRGFEEGTQLRRRHKGHILGAAATDDHGLPIGGHLAAKSRKVGPSLGVGHFCWHRPPPADTYRSTVQLAPLAVKRAILAP